MSHYDDHRIAQYTEKGWWGQTTLADRFQHNAATYPDRAALIDPPDREDWTTGSPSRLSYRDLNNAVEIWVGRFKSAGLSAGDIIVIQLPNIHELVVLLLASFRSGVIASPVLIQFDENELTQILDQLKPKWVITISRFKQRELGRDLATLAGHRNIPSWVIDQLPNEIETDRGALEKVSANATATICWTSGTEGSPKGVIRTHNQWLATGRIMAEGAQLKNGDKLLNTRPLVNMAAIGGSLCSWLACAGTLVLHHPLNMKLALKQIRDEGINITFMPPAFIVGLLKDSSLRYEADLSSLRILGSGSAAIPDWAVLEFERTFNVSLINFFGSNEGIALVSAPREISDPVLRARLFPRFGAPGYVWPSIPTSQELETRLVDIETGAEINKSGMPGELRMRGSTIFSQYFDNESATAAAFDEAGYYCSGDLFEIAGEGEMAAYYRFVGRCKEVIIRGGFNIAPAEIDGLLSDHPAISEVAAFGYADDRLGERVGVAVVLKPDVTITLADVTAFLKEKKIAIFKLPEHLMILDALPRNGLLKVLRRELTVLYERTL
jgi:acyl-CoA synthetase (AMP-forming)/AMP-acid ligase II